VKLSRVIAIVMLAVSLVALPALAEEKAPKADAKPAVKADAKPAAKEDAKPVVVKPVAKPDPAPIKAKVMATVGKKEITEDQVNSVLSRYAGIPPEQLPMVRKRVVGQMIQQELVEAYLKTAPCPEDKLAAEKKKLDAQLKQYKMTMKDLLERQGMTADELNMRVRMQVAMKTMQDQALSKEKIEALVKASPVSYFDGTKLKASHILIMSPPYASQADKAKARKTLADLAKQIADGKIKFADAAKEHSACPSSKDGGALGQAFTFDRMDPAFSKAAFALKGDEVSGIVESSFGFHLIKVTSREKGSGKAGDDAKELASRILSSEMEGAIIRKAAATNPVVMTN